jgi:pyruvate dehydrogenase E1 component beta subunit
MMVDFLGVAWSALLNGAAQFPAFSDGAVPVPLVVRAACGGGYGDGGQHQQALWGMIAAIPGIAVVVPSTPADAAGLMLAAVEAPAPVVFLEHKLLAAYWLDYLGGASRAAVSFDLPADGVSGEVPDPITPVPIGRAALRRTGGDVALLSVGVGVHRCLQAAAELADEGVQASVLDLRTVAPLDIDLITSTVGETGRVVVVDEDYVRGGLSGEVAAVLLEAGLTPRFARVAPPGTLPFARDLEAASLPSAAAIRKAVASLPD